MTGTDFYEVLGVSASSEPEVIEAAYRALLRKYQPDNASDGPLNPQKVGEINLAYETLRDPKRRAVYDLGVSKKTNVPDMYSSNGQRGGNLPPPIEQGNNQKHCTECSEPIRVNARVCRYCGARQFRGNDALDHATNVHTHIYPPTSVPTPVVKAPKPSSTFLTIHGWTLVCVLIVTVALVFIGSSDKSNQSDKIPDQGSIAKLVDTATKHVSHKLTDSLQVTTLNRKFLLGSWKMAFGPALTLPGPCDDYLTVTFHPDGNYTSHGATGHFEINDGTLTYSDRTNLDAQGNVWSKESENTHMRIQVVNENTLKVDRDFLERCIIV